jgi:hypothetical protein
MRFDVGIEERADVDPSGLTTLPTGSKATNGDTTS